MSGARSKWDAFGYGMLCMAGAVWALTAAARCKGESRTADVQPDVERREEE